jgi:hypothetical protein
VPRQRSASDLLCFDSRVGSAAYDLTCLTPYVFQTQLYPEPRVAGENNFHLERRKLQEQFGNWRLGAGWEAKQQTRLKMARDEHNKAAEHHENAAKAHRSAAEHHGKGDHAKGKEHAASAKQHSQTANQHSDQAHSKSQQQK